ncbi:MAG: hypothetical protein AUJ97_05200 [Bacteroidetes bacterium CG2_30_32_10]|nr:MAG: hypothetical protein AUJ97_05200 [Bacteroidetes bacterium CG2_30_32_10]
MIVPFLLFLDVGGGELLLILIAVFLLFGPKKIPEIARGIGKEMHEFQKATKDITEEIENSKNEIVENSTEIDDREKEK